MIDARDLSYKLLDLWREFALRNNNAADVHKNKQPVPVYVQDATGNLTPITSIEITADKIVMRTE
jgi:hypothetical protein